MADSAKELQLSELKDSISELNTLVKTLQEMIFQANEREALLRQERGDFKAQVDFLKSIDTRYIQGYYFSRPVPEEDYSALCYAKDEA